MSGIIRTVATIGAYALGGPLLGTGVNLAFGLLFPTKQAQAGLGSGQRLEVNTSEFDGPIPCFWGTMGKVGGNIVNVAKDKKGKPAGVLVKTKKKKVGGKGGAGSQTVKEEIFFLVAEYAIGMAGDFGPLFIDRIDVEESDGVQVWWDRDGEDENPDYTYTPEYSASGTLISETIEEGPRKITLQLGTEEQQPLAFLEEFWGVGNVCPHRGVATIGFNRAQIKSQPTFTFTVRSATTGRREIIKTRLLQCGIPPARLSLSQISGVVEGATVAGREAARDLCEKLASRVMCGFAFNNARVEDYSKQNPARWVLQDSDLAARSSEGAQSSGGNEIHNKTPFEMKGEEEFQSEVSASFFDIDNNYAENSAIAPRLSARHSNPQSYDLPEAAKLGDVLAWSRAMLDEDWAGDRTLEISVLPKHCRMVTGNVMQVPHRKTDGNLVALDYIITEQGVDPSGLLIFRGIPYQSGLHEQAGIVSEGARPIPTAIPAGTLYFQIFDCAPLHDAHTPGPGFYVLANWSEAVSGVEFAPVASGSGLVSGYQSAGGTQNALPARGTFGVSESALGGFAGDVETGWDDSTLILKLRGSGGVEDETDAAILGGYVNLLRVGDEIIQFVHATYLGEVSDGAGGFWQRYEISRFKRARRATEWAMSTHVAGEEVALLDNALLRVELSSFAVGQAVDYQFLFGDKTQAATFTCNGVSLKPFAPKLSADLAGDDWIISVQGRSRFLGWEINPAMPMQTAPPDTDVYVVEILNGATVARTLNGTGSGEVFVPYSLADQTADFGAAQTAISARAARLSNLATPAAPAARGYDALGSFEESGGASSAILDLYITAASQTSLQITLAGSGTLNFEWNNGTRAVVLSSTPTAQTIAFQYDGGGYRLRITGAVAGITTLKCEQKKLSRIDGAGSLAACEFLLLRGNELTDLPGVSALTALKELDLYSNKLPRAALEAQVDATHPNRVALGANSCVLRWSDNPGSSDLSSTRAVKLSELASAGCTVEA